MPPGVATDLRVPKQMQEPNARFNVCNRDAGICMTKEGKAHVLRTKDGRVTHGVMMFHAADIWRFQSPDATFLFIEGGDGEYCGIQEEGPFFEGMGHFDTIFMTADALVKARKPLAWKFLNDTLQTLRGST